MQYRKFGKLDFQVSALGFGCMRLPTTGEYASIDEPEAIRMIRYALDHGVNYVDTAYGYHGGNSERLVGKALQDGYREKVKLATKLPPWNVTSASDFDRILNDQLQKTQSDRIDFYLMHSLSKDSWVKLRDLGVLKWAQGAVADGRVGHLGFSFHDSFEVFKEIVDAFDWAFCQIQYNILNEDVQAGTRGLQYAASKGLAVVIMEPLLGGRLARPPRSVQALYDSAGLDRTPVEWALQWLWDKPEVSVVLSGMSTMQQVQENVASAERSGVGSLSQEERELIKRVQEKYAELHPIPCTGCEYCMPCPEGVNIPRLFAIYNEGMVYEEMEQARERYANLPADQWGSLCVQCRQCESLCPQHIEISDWIDRVHKELAPAS
ncbi:MAG: aldo/keto reductase [Anaerolineae bacterium]|nr:aldo/keto reductase [Anaerolineae bacterium]